ncbi:hypothetical protein ACIPYQ_07220 [Streptomyces sp. NPDC090045]|uniref:hypothetical protein n=1 Tax=Streptomyces sp. NPDC090045 TaxID=3365927 RepID=UPI00382E36A4
MRTALRTSIVTAALAGALLAPAAGTAFAASGTPGAGPVAEQGVVATGATASGVVKVDLGGNLVAHMGNSAAQGPRVEVRVVIDGETRPGIVATLDRAHTQVSKQGVIFNLTKADTAAPVLTVFLNGVTTPYPLPKATEAPTTCVSEVQQVEAGGGLLVDLTMSSKGPKAVLHNSDPAGSWSQTLDRTHPQGPSDHSVRIVNPSGAHPFLEWKTQGGNDVPAGKAYFPALPKGCKLDYKVTEGSDGKPAPKPSPSSPAKVQAQTSGQTSVVPKGAVAAGAEIPADTSHHTAYAAGAGLVAGLGAFAAAVLLRRRSRTQG